MSKDVSSVDGVPGDCTTAWKGVNPNAVRSLDRRTLSGCILEGDPFRKRKTKRGRAAGPKTGPGRFRALRIPCLILRVAPASGVPGLGGSGPHRAACLRRTCGAIRGCALVSLPGRRSGPAALIDLYDLTGHRNLLRSDDSGFGQSTSRTPITCTSAGAWRPYGKM
jgi:hypothetical protein